MPRTSIVPVLHPIDIIIQGWTLEGLVPATRDTGGGRSAVGQAQQHAEVRRARRIAITKPRKGINLDRRAQRQAHTRERLDGIPLALEGQRGDDRQFSAQLPARGRQRRAQAQRMAQPVLNLRIRIQDDPGPQEESRVEPTTQRAEAAPHHDAGNGAHLTRQRSGLAHARTGEDTDGEIHGILFTLGEQPQPRREQRRAEGHAFPGAPDLASRQVLSALEEHQGHLRSKLHPLPQAVGHGEMSRRPVPHHDTLACAVPVEHERIVLVVGGEGEAIAVVRQQLARADQQRAHAAGIELQPFQLELGQDGGLSQGGGAPQQHGQDQKPGSHETAWEDLPQEHQQPHQRPPKLRPWEVHR